MTGEKKLNIFSSHDFMLGASNEHDFKVTQ